ncbi:hypothetical protein [Streptomyces sp. NBC_01361]|uniref:hypothetical protein n=1 Tax=Streptomyces sp. NBC_01361 TaxID=2903838 RepID=UPI002E2F1BFB|nr:hypothetical protein [Streptomyces sp. NBC_01361]
MFIGGPLDGLLLDVADWRPEQIDGGVALSLEIATEVDRQLPGLTDGERRQAFEERLREQAAIEAENFVCRREQARADRAMILFNSRKYYPGIGLLAADEERA